MQVVPGRQRPTKVSNTWLQRSERLPDSLLPWRLGLISLGVLELHTLLAPGVPPGPG